MLSIAQLLLPVSAAHSCGEDLSFSGEVDEIARARQFDDPTLDQGEWVAELKEADWDFVATACARLLRDRSKDLRLAVWLAEAEAMTRGLRGLGDGYAVLAGLCEHYWDGLYPAADGGDCEQRAGNLYWLLTRTPALVRQLQRAAGGGAGTGPLADADYCLAMLGELERVVDRRLGADGPGFSAAREALRALMPAGTPALAALAHAQGGADVAAPEERVVTAGGAPRNRAHALAQLRLVAEFFRRTEPHSPVAYLADKAAAWGEMPLHLWLRAVIKDQGVIAGVEELLGSRAEGA